MTTTTKVLTAVILALLAAVGVQTWRVRHWQHTAAENALAVQNSEARHDTTRVAPLSSKDSARILGDSTRADEHLVVQQGITRDDLDRALGRQTTLIAALRAEIAALKTSSSGSVVGDTGLRVATYHVRQEPYTVDAIDSVPPAPGVSRLALSVAIDPARLRPRLQCGAPVRGVRPATILVTAPTWLPITVDSAQVDPRSCNPDLLTSPASRWHLGITLGYGVTAYRDSTRQWRAVTGPTITTGLTWSPF